MYPFHSESEKSYYSMVGFYITAFSGIEFALYTLIIAVGEILENPKYSPKKSISLSRKITLLTEAFESELLFSEKEEMRLVLKLVKEKSKLRHDLVHGVNRYFCKPEKWFTQMYRPEQVGLSTTKGDELTIVNEKCLRDEYEQINNLTAAILGVWARLTNPDINKLLDIKKL